MIGSAAKTHYANISREETTTETYEKILVSLNKKKIVKTATQGGDVLDCGVGDVQVSFEKKLLKL